MKVFIIVSAYNVSTRIAQVMRDLIEAGYENIVVVDDGSYDETASIVAQFPVTLLRHLVNRGQGAALQTGHNYAYSKGADMVIDFDGDGQMQVKDIPKFITAVRDGAQVVLGSRFIDRQSQANIPWLKRSLILRPARLFNNFVTGISQSDAHCGFRALSREALKVMNIRQDRMAHATEIVALTNRLHLKHAEVPVDIIYHEFGQGFSGGIKILRDLFIGKILS